MKEKRQKSLDIHIVICFLVCFVSIIFMLKERFVSIYFLFPCIMSLWYLKRYISTRNGYTTWEGMKKRFYIILIICFMSSFVSVYTMDTIDSFNATYGYIKTIIFHISDYQKIDFLSKSFKNDMRKRDLYIADSTDINQLISYVDEIAGFKNQIHNYYDRTYSVDTVQYGEIVFDIQIKKNYSIIKIYL